MPEGPSGAPVRDAATGESGHEFTDRIAYLGTPPAVTGVGSNRIRYAEGFRRARMRRYLNGANPSDPFRKAGLDPAPLGGKRIERTCARWRARGLDDTTPEPDDDRYFPYGEASGSTRGGVHRWLILQGNALGTHDDTDPCTAPESRVGLERQADSVTHDASPVHGDLKVDESDDATPSPDPRDLAMAQLTRYNRILEHENRELRRRRRRRAGRRAHAQ